MTKLPSLIFTLLISCNIYTQEEPTNTKSLGEHQQPNWAEDAYGWLVYELDSLGLHYTTVTNRAFYEKHQKKDEWQELHFTDITSFTIDSTQTFRVDNLQFEATYNEDMGYNETADYYYGGIEELKIYLGGLHIQTIKNIEDPTALGLVYIGIYDYNLDGTPDLKLRLNDNFFKFLLFNPKNSTFEHIQEWDYMRPLYYSKSQKQIITAPDGTAHYGEFYRYQLDGLHLDKLNTYYYHKINGEEGSFVTIVDAK